MEFLPDKMKDIIFKTIFNFVYICIFINYAQLLGI